MYHFDIYNFYETANMVKLFHQVLEARLIALTFMIMSLPSTASSKIIIMECNSKYYKYEQSLLGSKRVSIREDADWKQWCGERIIVTDKGAKCIKTNEKETIETEFNYSIYSEIDITRAKNILTNRWTYCRLNSDQSECIPAIKEYDEWWHFDLVYKFDGCKFKPIDENYTKDIKYYNSPLDEYLSRHLPIKGEQKCLLNKQDVITDIIRYDNIETLDFLIGTRELKNENYKFQSSNFEATGDKEFIAKHDCNIVN